MSKRVLENYGRVSIYLEQGHPSPVYHLDGQVPANPYGSLMPLLEDDALEEVMYNGGQQCVKVAHREWGICRTNIWIDDEEGLQIAKNIAAFTNVPLGDGCSTVASQMAAECPGSFRQSLQTGRRSPFASSARTRSRSSI